MLPGLRLVLAAMTATIVIVVLGFGQLVKLQVAQSHSASLAPVEARFAGLAFAERADWTPLPSQRRASLESLAPFARLQVDRPDSDADAVTTAALTRPEAEPQPAAPVAEPPPDAAEWDVAAISPEIASASAEPLQPTPPGQAEAEPPALVASLPDATGESTPVPVARPASAPQRKAQPGPAKKKAARTSPRKRTAPAKPAPASTAPSDPLSALLGRPSTTSAARN